ncbi:tryptophan--tRNA ligase [Gloeomargarita lithophora]|nr:tryptophan--tRNA ligase [Gloeomargarita lithophora]
MKRPRILSGVQPTGNLHLGNYLGAIRNWVSGQTERENYFCVVDLHAMTVPYTPSELAQNSYTVAALYLACGLDPQYSVIFIQSHVPAHSQLAWLLNCITPLNWLERMIQFKEKALKQGEDVGVGLLDYPVLMAADILLYQADLVPVGEDQKQHLELTRDIAQKFNHLFAQPETPILQVPEPLIGTAGARVMSLTDGTSKMSKSDPSDLSRINLLDPPDMIQKKIKRCKTDPMRGLEFDHPERPECHNLLTLYQIFTQQEKATVANAVKDMGWGEFKPKLTEAIIEHLRPLQAKYQELMGAKDYLYQVLQDGRERANQVAGITLERVQKAMGMAIPASKASSIK